ncbi:SprT family zinc-dependent metalloprotease [Vibrio sonorensis]|uniref:SprT family zinc-dependent metalloprotease n=1 Tax=Vibrio sonorensis TaxID=1004316 RepID=UPI0008D99B94
MLDTRGIFYGVILIGEELLEQVQLQIETCIKAAQRYYDTHFPLPTVSFKLRGKSAGKAYLQLWEIRLNPTLMVENRTAFMNQVIPHEIAHLVTHRLFGKVRPHGKEWQSVMKECFGLKPETTHQFSIASVQGKTFEYRCQCTTYPLTIRRHNKVQRQSAIYRCRSCNQPLLFTGVELS